MTDGEAREMARELVRGSIIEDAASQFIAQILKHAHDERVKPLRKQVADLEAKLAKAVGALEPMAAIAHAYDENELDDEARKFWGRHYEHENHTPHDQIELYQGRGGKRLLTLEDCMKARATLAEIKGGSHE